MSLPTTTLTQALTALDSHAYLASLTSVVAGGALAINQEIVKVLIVGPALTVKIQRGLEGTAAVAHDSGSTVLIGTPSDFSLLPVSVVVTGTTPNRATSVVAQDSTPTSGTTTTGIATVTT